MGSAAQMARAVGESPRVARIETAPAVIRMSDIATPKCPALTHGRLKSEDDTARRRGVC